MKMDQIIEQLQGDFQEIYQRSLVNGELWRAPYTRQDRESKEYLFGLMERKGFAVEEDPVGNLIGTIQGLDPREAIMAGSHLDTVRNGGQYDGLYGVLAAIYAIGYLLGEYGQPKRNILAAGLMEEEGSRYLGGYIGSKALVGSLSQEDLEACDANGIRLYDAIEGSGGNPASMDTARREDLAAFYEIHIEQGPVLDQEGLQVGLVESINGLLLLQIRVHGRQDHAGTCPMDMRKDALLHACKLIAKLDHICDQVGKSATATVGELMLKPGSSNVVPDFVQFTLDIRSSQAEAIEDIVDMIREEILVIESAGLSVELEVMLDEDPVRLDPECLLENETICRALGFSYRRMHSGAGHDAQVIATYLPTALIFVPCIEGKSHSPEEMMTESAMADGIKILAEILYKKAWQ